MFLKSFNDEMTNGEPLSVLPGLGTVPESGRAFSSVLGRLLKGSTFPPDEEEGSQVPHSGLPSSHPLSPAGSSCEGQPAATEHREAEEGLFTYLFRPSQHTRSRQVTSAQLWFHTGLDRQGTAASNSSGPQLGLLALSSGGLLTVPMSLDEAPPRWAVLRLAASALPLLTHPILVLLLSCPLCSCSARPETTPFLVAHTRAKPPSGGERARRSTPPLPWPWSPAALRLLQRPPEEPAAHAHCHRAALNISFQELGWDRWIVHPPSFIFYYCHGGCGLPTRPNLSLPASGPPPTPVQPHSLVPGAQPCCAALPGTMRSLPVRTTSDGGYSFKYETVPSLLTQHCVCV